MKRQFRLLAAPIAASFAVSAAILSAPAAAEVQVVSQGPVIALTITETVAADPDIATLSAGVTTIALNAVDALEENSENMDAVIARLEALGIDERDIQTTGVNVNPQYDYDPPSQQQIFRGYRVTNRVSVKLREVARTGRVLDELVAAGATDIGGISWSIDDPSAAQDQARATALETARERALSMAQGAGYAGIRLLEISENISSSRPMPMLEMAEASAVRNESAPIRPGQVRTGVTISVTYEMTP